MICSRHVARKRAPIAGVMAAVVASVLLSEGRAHAQAIEDVGAEQVGVGSLPASRRLLAVGGGDGIAVGRWAEASPKDTAGARPRNLGRLQATLGRAAAGSHRMERLAAFQSASRSASVGRRVAGGVLGAVGGFFAGGFLGARIEGHGCHCDDPGLKGFMIGAPIGAVVGGILGARFF